MKAVRLIDDIREFLPRDIARPALLDGTVRVRIEAAFLPPYFEGLPAGTWRTPPRPFTPGQCAIGIVEEVAAPRSHLKVGQRVYCDMYIEGSGPEADHGFIGCFGLAPASSRHLATWPNGTFAEEFVGPEQCFTVVPETIAASPSILCRLGWFATALAGFRRGGFRAGSVVAINGASGLLGTSAAVVALALGAAEVRLLGRRSDVLGPVAALDRRLVIEEAGDQTPIDLVLDCSGGANAAAAVALSERLRRFGSMTFVGALSERAAFDTSALMRNSNSLIGSFWFPHEAAAEVLALIAAGAIDLSAFTARTFKLNDISAAMIFSVRNSGGLHHVALEP